MTRTAPIIAASLAALLLLFGAYMGSYYAMLRSAAKDGDSNGRPVGDWWPVYRIEARPVRYFMWPAHQLDRLIRRDYWEADLDQVRTPTSGIFLEFHDAGGSNK
jgi:hypothetical protein